ncbi:MAG: 2-hydroxyacyl-CoA dehydratase [Clostridia bacterium]|nr:2-hydroxyacyl-CoA dehydratase [Clostridia bacterium]
MSLRIGLDVGSTTLKCVVLNENNNIIYANYERHFSKISEKSCELLCAIANKFPNERDVHIAVSGSAGMGFAEDIELNFIQEVFATKIAISAYIPDTDVVIELGGEDAKILFLTGGTEVRMNGSCAGGTGAFIDQMASLLNMTAHELNLEAKNYSKIYNIASRCGVFAKSDIQPLINQGAKKEDISKSILNAVVNQTISGLAQGREIKGKIVYLGGPLTFLSELRESFDYILGNKGICPENSLYFVAIGTALSCDDKIINILELKDKIKNTTQNRTYNALPPLFENEEQYNTFLNRHNKAVISTDALLTDSKIAYIGIDSGSTTIKATLINENEDIVYSIYRPNSGNPVPIVKDFLTEVYNRYPDINIMGSATTGYGEEIIKNAFRCDFGIVETIAHYTAAKKYNPNVDFIIDIGGQDIKCFKISNGAIDNIFLNEACSSGCGSFLQSFAGALGYSIADFAKLGLYGERPVDLGSRCTVFMNSSVKQAQKDGASIENISAGLSISIVKNALYKVIRVSSAKKLGNNIVVQGGTFLNDAVLRAFEQEIGHDVIRPAISGVMGAYGAALYAKQASRGKSDIINKETLKSFKHEVNAITCNGCTNRCKLTVNTFSDTNKYIAGNQCDKPIQKNKNKECYNMYEYKRQLLSAYTDCKGIRDITIGLPMALNMYEMLPFWHTFFTKMGFSVKLSGRSTRKLYLKGQNSIPSDTVCYPAKLVHGHIVNLCESGVDAVFYPCMTYNFDEGLGDNHYNCPVVAYYPLVIAKNMNEIQSTVLINNYIGIDQRKYFPKKFTKILSEYFDDIKFKDVKAASDAAYKEYYAYIEKIEEKGEEFLKIANEKKLPVIVLCGRPYHLDHEIDHGIDKFISEAGAVLISEDGLGKRYSPFPTTVLNQWTYHARLYGAAKFVCDSNNPDINLVQLVSFGCGVDAVTTDEVRSILWKNKKIYTQIKIDEITNLGAVKIRLRSLFAAIEQKKNNDKAGGTEC